jgi:hypothetical protein
MSNLDNDRGGNAQHLLAQGQLEDPNADDAACVGLSPGGRTPDAEPDDAIECPAIVAAEFSDDAPLQAGEAGDDLEIEEDDDGGAGEWLEMMAGDDAAVDDLSSADAAMAGEELAAHLSTLDSDETETWSFTLETGRLGDIDGQVVMGAGQVNVELRPRARPVSRFLRHHRDTLEEIASSELHRDVIVRVF